MAGETIGAFGTFATVQAADSMATGEFSTGSTTDIDAALTTGSESLYPLLDFRLTLSSGTPTDGATMAVYRIPKAGDGTASPTPDDTSVYKAQYVGSFVMHDTASSVYYLFGVENCDPYASYILENLDGTATLTGALAARGRGFDTVA